MADKILRPQILVVDDEQNFREVISYSLKLNGYDVSVAQNGLEAINALTVNDFDMVLMDVRMPVMDGISATKFIRKCEQSELGFLDQHSELANSLHSRIKGSRIPVVACTADVFDLEFLEQAGVDEYVLKPFKLEMLCAVLNQFCEGTKAVTNTPQMSGGIETTF